MGDTRNAPHVHVIWARRFSSVGGWSSLWTQSRVPLPYEHETLRSARTAGGPLDVHSLSGHAGAAPRSVRDLRRRLSSGRGRSGRRRHHPALTAAGLLDDAAYARSFVRSKVSSQGFSRRRLQQELAKRGVARDVADAAIVEVLHDDEVDEGANVERAALKKLRTLRGLDEETQRRRLYGYLARRGYSAGDVRVVLERLRRTPLS